MSFPPAVREFSRRESQIVGALLQARSVKDIAVDLRLSPNTIKDYLKNIYIKAQVHSARELMVKMRLETADLPDFALAGLLDALQALLDPLPPDELVSRLAAAVRACTPARKLGFFKIVRERGELLLIPGEGRASAPLRPGAFLRRALDCGAARLEPEDLPTPESRQLEQLGFPGDLLALRCALPRHQFLLAGDPRDGRFAPLDLPTLRLLVRMVEAAVPLLRRAASA